MNRTLIEWVKNPDGSQGYTWNPITGCLGPKGDGVWCPYCYARKLANGRLRSRYLANTNLTPLDINIAERPELASNRANDPFYPRSWEDRLDDPFLVDRNICIRRHTRGQRRTPRGIFVCDMGELFGDWLPREWQEEIHLTITLNPQHRFYLLTKWPQNLIKFSPFPDNCWVGVTCTTSQQLYNSWDKLFLVKAKVKYISFEPLLERIDANLENIFDYAGINWVIIGAQTKPYKPPEFECVSEIVSACDKASIPVFLKNNLKKIVVEKWSQDNIYNIVDHTKTLKTGLLELRQEMPGLLCKTG